MVLDRILHRLQLQQTEHCRITEVGQLSYEDLPGGTKQDPKKDTEKAWAALESTKQTRASLRGLY